MNKQLLTFLFSAFCFLISGASLKAQNLYKFELSLQVNKSDWWHSNGPQKIEELFLEKEGIYTVEVNPDLKSLTLLVDESVDEEAISSISPSRVRLKENALKEVIYADKRTLQLYNEQKERRLKELSK